MPENETVIKTLDMLRRLFHFAIVHVNPARLRNPRGARTLQQP